MIKVTSKCTAGFTLIEMVTVIIILGILAIGTSSFLQFGARIFSETSDRDELISSARFAIERLNREVRHAVPNSIYVDNSSGFDCLIFTPIVASAVYIDLPVAPEAKSDKVKLVSFNKDNFAEAKKVIVYPLKSEDFDDSSGKHHVFLSLDESVEPWQLSFAAPVHFESDSPTKRIYFYGNDTRYCVEGRSLARYDVSDSASEKALMAENIINYLDENGDVYDDPNDVVDAFKVIEASLTRNATVQIKLLFGLNNESVMFNNEVQIPNVP